MSTTETPVRGKRIRMATYTCDVGERQIVGQRVDGEVLLYDEPARDGGRRYFNAVHDWRRPSSAARDRGQGTLSFKHRLHRSLNG